MAEIEDRARRIQYCWMVKRGYPLTSLDESYGFWAAHIPAGYLKLRETGELVLYFLYMCVYNVFNEVSSETEREEKMEVGKKKK